MSFIHHVIVRVNVDLIQFVYGLHLKRDPGAHTIKNSIFAIFHASSKEAEANEQHKSIISALKAATLKWEIEQIKFVVDKRGSVVESDFFYTKLIKLDVQKEKKTSSSLIM